MDIISAIATVLGAAYVVIRLVSHFRKAPLATIKLEFLAGGYTAGRGEDERLWVSVAIWARVANKGPGRVSISCPKLTFHTRDGKQLLDKIYCFVPVPERTFMRWLRLSKATWLTLS